MQTETTIIVIGLLIGWIATAFYLIKANNDDGGFGLHVLYASLEPAAGQFW